MILKLPKSLVFRIISFALALSLFGGILRFYVVSCLFNTAITHIVLTQLQSQANYVGKDIDGKNASRKYLLENLAKQIPEQVFREPLALEFWLADRYVLAPYFDLGLAVIPSDGKGVIADYPPLSGLKQFDFSNEDWFRTARDEVTFSIGKAKIGQFSGKGIVVMAVPIQDNQGRVKAVISGATTLDAPGFLDLIQDSAIGSSGGFLLISPRDKLFVAASLTQMRLQPLPQAGANLLHDRAMEGWRGTGVTKNAFGIEELIAVASVPIANWFVVARIPTQEAFSAADTLQKYQVYIAVIVTLSVVIIVYLFLVHALGPLKNSSRRIYEMARNEVPLDLIPITHFCPAKPAGIAD